MKWRPARWCLSALLAGALAAPAEGYGAEPLSKGSGDAPSEPAEQAPATVDALGQPTYKMTFPDQEQDKGAPETEVQDPSTGPSMVPVLLGAGIAVVGLTLALAAFSDAADSRSKAEQLNEDVLRSGRTNPCTAVVRFQTCTTIDTLNGSADVGIGVGLSALVSAGGGLLVMGHQMFGSTSSPTNNPSPQVALTKVPGGGVLTVVGTF